MSYVLRLLLYFLLHFSDSLGGTGKGVVKLVFLEFLCSHGWERVLSLDRFWKLSFRCSELFTGGASFFLNHSSPTLITCPLPHSGPDGHLSEEMKKMEFLHSFPQERPRGAGAAILGVPTWLTLHVAFKINCHMAYFWIYWFFFLSTGPPSSHSNI